MKFFLLALGIIFGTAQLSATVAKMSQLGFSAGEIPDAETDTLMLNPAYGHKIDAWAFSIGPVLAWEKTACFGNYCPLPNEVTSFITGNLFWKFQNLFGFYGSYRPILDINWRPNKTNLYGYYADFRFGAWVKILNGLHLGGDMNYYSQRMLITKNYENDEYFRHNVFFYSLGAVYELLNKITFSYGLRYNSHDLREMMSLNLSFAGTLKYENYLPMLLPKNSVFYETLYAEWFHSLQINIFNLWGWDFLNQMKVFSLEKSQKKYYLYAFSNYMNHLYIFSSYASKKIETTEFYGGFQWNYYDFIDADDSKVWFPKEASFLLLKLGMSIKVFENWYLRVGFSSLVRYHFVDNFIEQTQYRLEPQFTGGFSWQITPNWSFELTLSQLFAIYDEYNHDSWGAVQFQVNYGLH